MVIAAGAQERGPAGQRTVAPGHLAQLPLDLQLGHGGGQLQGRVAIPVGDVGEQVINGAQANGGQQLILLGNCVGNVVGLEVGYHSGLLRGNRINHLVVLMCTGFRGNRQNQDLRDYRILRMKRTLPAVVILPIL